MGKHDKPLDSPLKNIVYVRRWLKVRRTQFRMASCQSVLDNVCLAGSCIVNATQNLEFCECNDGFVNANEPPFFFDEQDLERAVCSYQLNTFKALYWIDGIIGLTAIVLQLLLVDDIRQVTRIWQTFAAAFFFSFSAFYKLSDIDGIVFGGDPLFTFGKCLAVFFLNASFHQFVLKAIHILVSESEWTSTNVQNFVNKFKVTGSIFFALTAVGFTLMASTSLISNRRVQLILCRIFLVMQLGIEIHSTYFVLWFKRLYGQDIISVAKYKGNLGKKDDINDFPEIKKWVRRSKAQVYNLSISAAIKISGSVMMVGVPLISPILMQSVWCYTIPVLSAAYCSKTVFESIIGYQRYKRKKLKAALQSQVSSYGSAHSVPGRNNFHKHVQASGEIMRTDTQEWFDDDSDEDEMV